MNGKNETQKDGKLTKETINTGRWITSMMAAITVGLSAQYVCDNDKQTKAAEEQLRQNRYETIKERMRTGIREAKIALQKNATPMEEKHRAVCEALKNAENSSRYPYASSYGLYEDPEWKELSAIIRSRLDKYACGK